jgi:hypothetical protein
VLPVGKYPLLMFRSVIIATASFVRNACYGRPDVLNVRMSLKSPNETSSKIRLLKPSLKICPYRTIVIRMGLGMWNKF